MQINIDTLRNENLLELQLQLEAISRKVEISAIREEYFNSIISHSWQILSIQTMIFVFIITAILIIAGFISWNYFIRRINFRIKLLDDNYEKIKSDYESQILELKKRMDKLLTVQEDVSKRLDMGLMEIEDAVKHANRNAARGLYEQKEGSDVWRVIWHIRYIHWFDTSELDAIRTRMKQLEIEYKKIKSEGVSYYFLKRFPNIGGIREILYKLSELSDEEVKRIALEIFDDLGEDVNNDSKSID